MIIRKLSDNTKLYIDRYFAVVDEMIKSLKEVEQTNSISEMFINQMIVMHESSIKLSENILSYTTNSNIEMIAKSFVESGNSDKLDLVEMLNFCRSCKNEERDISLYQRKNLLIIDSMISQMNGINISNNIDLDFLSGMIGHHEGEIEMAKNLLGYETCENLRNYAEKLIVSHQLQVNQMKKLQKILN